MNDGETSHVVVLESAIVDKQLWKLSFVIS